MVESCVEEIAQCRAQSNQPRAFSAVRAFACEHDLQRVAPKQVIVGGTNGKGTTVAYLQQLLTQQGLRVGVTTSPHLHSYVERIALDGRSTTPYECLNALRAIERDSKELRLTYFDLTTLAALHLFKQWQVDVAIIEVGLGGRLDCANVVDSDVAIITNVDLDHRAELGNTREAISREKVAITRPRKSLVLADERENCVIAAYALLHGTPVFQLGRAFGVEHSGHIYVTQGTTQQSSTLKAPRDVGVENFTAALQAATLLGYGGEIENVASAQVKKPYGRVEQVNVNGQEWIFDIAHNPAAIEYVRRWLSRRGIRKFVAVFACFRDKDVIGMLDSLATIQGCFDTRLIKLVLTDSQGLRSLKASKIARVAPKVGINYSVESNLADALSVAQHCADANSPIVVLGSFDVVSRAREYLILRGRNDPM